MAARSLRISALVVAAAACGHHEAPPEPPAADVIPRISMPIAIDGELNEPPWNQRSYRAVLAGDDGKQARPYSELRLLHDGASLYVGLYAADEDIKTSDRWTVTVGPRVVHVDAAGHADAPDVRAGVDRDGTLDDPHDYDEEWVIELAVPLASLPAPPLALAAERCDTPKDGRVRCGRWHAQLGLE
ncbi:MAG TPA: hypothetical protein VGF94_16185 [Kofleriaceae bacterium]|jgi:hypothetical protein